jgi:hypothetical protein
MEAMISDTMMPPSSSSVTMAARRVSPPKITSPARLGAFCCDVLPGGVALLAPDARWISDMRA